jgi:hypothetical protein
VKEERFSDADLARPSGDWDTPTERRLAAQLLSARYHEQELQRQVQQLVDERATLLSDMVDSYEALQAVELFRDWPADTVLGGNGVAAIAELEKARGGMGGRLANYPDRQIARVQVRARRKARHDELLAKLAARRAAAGEPTS